MWEVLEKIAWGYEIVDFEQFQSWSERVLSRGWRASILTQEDAQGYMAWAEHLFIKEERSESESGSGCYKDLENQDDQAS